MARLDRDQDATYQLLTRCSQQATSVTRASPPRTLTGQLASARAELPISEEENVRRTASTRTMVATTGLTVATLLGLAAPAQAAGARDGTCDSGEFCYYYNSNNLGSVADFSSSVSVSDYGTSK